MPETLVVFGSGLQIQEHIRLHLEAYASIIHCCVMVRYRTERAITLVADSERRFGNVKFTIIADPDSYPNVVHTADIICCATPSMQPLIQSSWVRDGTHINIVGSYTPTMTELPVDLIRRASKPILIDSKEAAKKEAGDLIQADIDWNSDVIEMGELCTQGHSKRTDSIPRGGITIFKSVGISEQDITIADATFHRALEMRLGTVIPDYDDC